MLGLLFDLDGTLALTNGIHELAWRSVLADHGVALSPSDFAREISGRSNPEIVRRLLPRLSAEAGEQVALGKEAMFRQMATQLDTLPGLVELVRRVHDLGCKLAVVTNAPSANAVHVLRILGLDALFNVIVGAEHVDKPKPEPDPYLLAARRLGLLPNQCVAFEDSPSGAKAAFAAGIPVACVLTGHTAVELSSAGAALIVQDFLEPALGQWLDQYLPGRS